jgi:hypothetical protein
VAGWFYPLGGPFLVHNGPSKKVNDMLFNHAITRTAKIAEQKTTTDRKSAVDFRYYLAFSVASVCGKTFLAAAE